jgi:hypothetical protein
MENTKAGKSKNAQGQGTFKKVGREEKQRKKQEKKEIKKEWGGYQRGRKRSKYKTKTEQIQKYSKEGGEERD